MVPRAGGLGSHALDDKGFQPGKIRGIPGVQGKAVGEGGGGDEQIGNAAPAGTAARP